jgi:hypothetical protein
VTKSVGNGVGVKLGRYVVRLKICNTTLRLVRLCAWRGNYKGVGRGQVIWLG